MDFSRLKKVLAGASVAAISLTQMGTAFAAYSDVPSGVWYGDAVDALTGDGILDTTQTRFRGSDLANRAEFTKLLIQMNGGLLSTPPSQASFDDVKASAWYYAYMEEAGKEGWVKGDGDCYGSHPCYARPAGNINRAEAAALIVRAFALEGTGDAPQFVDNPSGQWYTAAVQTAADHCVLQGDDSTGRVRPADNMNRAEMVVMLHRVDQGLTFGVDCGTNGGPVAAAIKSVTSISTKMVDVEFTVNMDQATAEMVSHYSVSGATPAVTVTAAKLIADDTVELTLSGDLTPSQEYTLTATDVMSDANKTFSDSASFTGYTTIPQSPATLEASVSSKNPVGDTVPQGAVGVTMLSVDLTASCDGSVMLEDLTVLHEGFGKASDIDGVYASVDGARVSRKRTVDSKDQTADIHFTKPLTIAACKTVTVDVVGDFASTATTSAEHNITVELPSDVQSNAKSVTGNFPMRGSTFKVAAVRSGQVSVSYRTVTPSEVQVGDKLALVGRFEVSTDSIEDQTLYSITMEQNGSANDGDLTNLKVRRTDGTVLTNTVATTSNGFATFIFNPPFTVLEGDKITLEVVADINGGAGSTAVMHFEETSDVFAVGSLYGYGVNGQLYGSRVSISSATSASTVTIDAGEFTIQIDGPVQQTYTRDQNDAVLANVVLTSGTESANIRKMFVAIQANTASGGVLASNNGSDSDEVTEILENVTLRNKTSGRSVEGVPTTDKGAGATTTGTFQVYRFDDFTVSGMQTYEIRVDFTDNGSGKSPKNGDQFKVHICTEPTEISSGTNTNGCDFGGFLSSKVSAQAKSFQLDIEGLSTGDNINDVRPGGTVSGNSQRIADANLSVAVKSIGTSDTAVKNSKNINLLRFETRAGEAKDILFTRATFNSASGSLNNAQNYTLWVDTDSDGKVDTILDKGKSAQGGKVTFDNLTGGGFVVPKEKTVVFEVHGDIVSSLTNDDLQIQFSTADSDYIQAEQVDRGSNLSGIKTNGTCSAAPCDITVTTVASQLYTLVNQGNLYVSRDTTATIRNRQLLGGALGESAVALNFRAEYEDIDVTDIQLNSSGSTASSVDRLELYKLGATTPFASATVGGCGSDDVLTQNPGNGGASIAAFCAKMQSRQLVVTKGSDVKVYVRPRMKSDVDGALTGQKIQFFINKQAVSNNASGSGAIRARGDQSSNNLVANSGDSTANGEVFIGNTSATATNSDIIGNLSVSTLSKILTIANANPDANGTNVPTGPSDIGQFTFTAAPNSNSKNGLNKVVLSGAVFNVNATNTTVDNTAGSIVFYNKANSTVTATCVAYSSTGAILAGATISGNFVAQCAALTSSSVNTTIDQGTSQTFVLKANITSTSSTSILQVILQNFDNLSRTTFGPGSTSSHLQWVDQDSGQMSLTGTSTTTIFNWVEYPDTTVKSTSYQNS